MNDPFEGFKPISKNDFGSAVLHSLNNVERDGPPTGPLSREQMWDITKRLEPTYIGLMKEADNRPDFLNEILPMEFSKEIIHEEGTTHYECIMPMMVPSRGVPRTGRLWKTMQWVKLESHAIAIELDGEVELLSPEGKQEIARSLAHMAGSIQQYLLVQGYKTLMVAAMEHHQPPPARNRDEKSAQIQREVDEVGIMHKQKYGFSIMAQSHIKAMQLSRAGGTPQWMYIPHGKTAVVTTGNEAYIEYRKAGQGGVDRLTGNGTVLRMFDMDIIEAPMDVTPDCERLPIDHDLITAEFWNVMSQEEDPANSLPKIRLYNVYKDRMMVLKFQELVDESGIFDYYLKDAKPFEDARVPLGAPGAPVAGAPVAGAVAPVAGAGDDFQTSWALFLHTKYPWVGDDEKWKRYTAYLTTEMLEAVKAVDKMDPKPEGMEYKFAVINHVIGFRLARPNMCYQMQSVLICGDGIGKTLHSVLGFDGLRETDRGHDAATNTTIMASRFRLAFMFKNLAKCRIARNATDNGIGQGNSTGLLTPEMAHELAENSFTMASHDEPAICIIPMLKKDLVKNDINWDIRGSDEISERATVPEVEELFSMLFGWNNLNVSEHGYADPISTQARHGYFEQWNSNNDWTEHKGYGHHGEWEGQGCQDVRSYGMAMNRNL